jgi:hypothetical protein
VSATGASPFGTSSCTDEGLAGEQAHSTVYFNSEVEPFVASDPTDATHLVGAHQQDRWNDGGSRGIVTAVSTDGGTSWAENTTDTKSSFCTGGAGANGGDFQRSTDPWVTVSPDGTTYLMTLSLNDPNTSADHAMLVMRSPDGGSSWDDPTTLIRENLPTVLNDKNSITADPNSSDFVYAVWDRLEFPNAHARAAAVANAFPFKGPAYFSRTTDGGDHWSAPLAIFGQGSITQTIGNQIVVLPDFNDGTFEGQLIDGFANRTLTKGGNVNGFDNVALVRSPDQGATWSKHVITVSKLFDVGVTDPLDGHDVRTGGDIPEFAVDASDGTLYAVWQDGRFSSFLYDSIAFSQSTDGGLTWSAPIKINQTPETGPDGNRQAFTPSVHVLPDGTVGVTYYDFRNNGTGDTSTDPLETDYFMVHCHAADVDCSDADNWTAETRITGSSFDMRTAPDAVGYFTGDYEGLTSTTILTVDSFLAFFSQSNGTGDRATVYASNVGP